MPRAIADISDEPPQWEDDKAPICIPFILSLLPSPSSTSTKPFIVGLNGPQGIGKTTLVSLLAAKLLEEGYEVLVLSIDDFYLRREDQVALARSLPENKLVQHRGEPGTHDVALAVEVFEKLCRGQRAKIPRYDKAAHAGRGDRLPEDVWTEVNGEGQPTVQVIILEGWCVGFRSLPADELRNKWEGQSKTLKSHRFEDLQFVNERLKDYDALTDLFDAFIHLDSEDISYVYDWRLEQEAMLREKRGTGMTDEEVIGFVNGYYPAYELYVNSLRRGVLERRGRQLRLAVQKDRMVKDKHIM